MSVAWIDQAHAGRPQTTIPLDTDRSVGEIDGMQEDSTHNGRFGCTCSNLLFVFDRFGELGWCALRPGNMRIAAVAGVLWSRVTTTSVERRFK